MQVSAECTRIKPPVKFAFPDTPAWSRLRELLLQSGYTEAGLRERLGVGELSQLLPEDLPAYLERCSDGSSQLLLTRVFQLAQPAPRGPLLQLLGPELLEWLERRGWLTGESQLRSEVDLTPCQGLYVFTDPQLAARDIPDRVYQLGLDSLVLARVTPRLAGRRALDLCTGSGVQALLAARDHAEVVGVDLNPKALDYARCNASLNGLESRCRFVPGDLYSGAEGRFDLITANPPFVPTPQSDMELHRTGGESGEEISTRLVAGLPAHLEAGGVFSMVLDYPITSTSTYLERLASWLAPGPKSGRTGPVPGWGIALLNFGNENLPAYIRRHIDPLHTPNYVAVYRDYLESYARQAISSIAFGNVFIQRLTPDHPGFAVERWMKLPSQPVGSRVESWLGALARYRRPDWQPDWRDWKPRVDPTLLGDVWLNLDRSRGILDVVNLDWTAPLSVDGPCARLVARCNGRNSAESLVAWWVRTFRLDPGSARAEVKLRLAWLAENLVCE